MERLVYPTSIMKVLYVSYRSTSSAIVIKGIGFLVIVIHSQSTITSTDSTYSQSTGDKVTSVESGYTLHT